MIKTKTGLEDEYLKQITGTVKPVYEEAKKQKIVLSYKILNGESSNPHDFNILILVEYPNMAAFTSKEFSFRSQLHWLTKTKAGIAFGYAAALGLLVGAVVTSQTLYAAVAASLR